VTTYETVSNGGFAGLSGDPGSITISYDDAAPDTCPPIPPIPPDPPDPLHHATAVDTAPRFTG
jgi:hypothetical protein